MRRPGQLISRAIDLLHKAGFLPEKADADEAVAAVNRAVAAILSTGLTIDRRARAVVDALLRE